MKIKLKVKRNEDAEWQQQQLEQKPTIKPTIKPMTRDITAIMLLAIQIRCWMLIFKISRTVTEIDLHY